ncbi:MAG: N-6 DNA methylase [Acidobacteria bacterium]|nr:N-6 DNA methylase [Acidobacteriota bacterium]
MHDSLYGPDIIGSAYMEMLSGRSSKWNYNAQYFTPWPVALMMAKMQVADRDIEQEFHAQVRKVVNENPVLQALAFACGMGDQTPEGNGQALRFFIERAWPLIQPKLRPITVQDCCVGSGIMLLAFAACHPLWLSQIGFIQYYGQDIDALCVEMTRLNMRLYGITPVKLEPITSEAMTQRVIESEELKPKFEEAIAAQANGDKEKFVEAAQTSKQARFEQGALFEIR